MNIRFPETDIVSCVFSLKNSTNACDQNFTNYGIVTYEDQCKLKEYHYHVPAYLQGQLNVGDYVVVHCQTGYQVCQVHKVNEFAPVDTNKLAPVVAKVDLMAYFEELDRQEELERMKAALVKERKRLEEQVTWDLIASKSPEFKEMLEQFRKMGGEL